MAFWTIFISVILAMSFLAGYLGISGIFATIVIAVVAAIPIVVRKILIAKGNDILSKIIGGTKIVVD